MPSPYGDTVIIERFQASVSAANLGQPFVAPTDLEIIGLVASAGTAPGSTNAMTINLNVSPTSQLGVAASPSPYNAWTAASVPTITGSAKTSYATTNTTTVIENRPYPLNYPLPGPGNSTGYVTAQSTSQTTENAVTAPPTLFQFKLPTLVLPDNTYTDLNGFTTSAGLIHAGDVVTFVVGGVVGSAANLAISLFLSKR